MSGRRWLKQAIEAGCTCLALCILPWLPRRCIVSLSRLLADLGFRCSRRWRRVALANLESAFGSSLDDAAKIAIARGCFRTACIVVLDVFWFSFFTERRVRRCVSFDPSFDAFLGAKPAIVVGAHLGNWEVLGLAVALIGEPCLSVTLPLSNPFSDKILSRARRLTGQRVTQARGALRAMLSCLRDGGRVALLLDQNTLPEDGGVFVPFFSLDVPVSKAVSSLAARTGAPVVVLYCLLDESGMYKAYAKPVFLVQDEDHVGATRRVMETVESVVRSHPEQWLWFYKRWKYVPPGGTVAKHPFYARIVKAGSRNVRLAGNKGGKR